MLLASVQSIRESLGYDDMTDINTAIEMSLHAAEHQIASVLQTSFERSDVTDTFWVYRPGFVQGAHSETQFKLSRGFLASAPTIEVVEAGGFSSGASKNVTGSMAVDLERGVVTDFTTRFTQQYVRFTYQAGFEPDPDNDQSYNLDQVPSWLQEAAKLRCLIHIANNPSITEVGIKLDTPVLEAQYAALIHRHLRYAPMALLPM